MILTFVSATKMTTAANAIFLQYTGPLYVLAFAPFLLKERFRRVDAVAVAVALAGMSLFFVGRLDPGALEGNLVAVVAGFFFGLVILLLRRDAAGDAIPSVIAGNFLAAALAFPFAFGHLALDGRGILLVLFLGIVQLGISYVLFVRGLDGRAGGGGVAPRHARAHVQPALGVSRPRREALGVGPSRGRDRALRRRGPDGVRLESGGSRDLAVAGLKEVSCRASSPFCAPSTSAATAS